MSGLPVLSHRDLKEALEKRYPLEAQDPKKRRRTYVAYYGVGAPDSVLTPLGPFDIVPVESELHLREELLARRDEDLVAFLVPWSGDLPLDLAGRFSGSGRVLRIGTEARLKTLFGVRDIDPDARESALAKYLLRRAGSGSAYQLGVGRLTKQALFEAWLERDLGVEVQGGLGLDLMLAWAATDAHGPQVATALTSDAAAGVREATLAYLGETLGPAGPLLWKRWENGQGRSALELALLFEATVGSRNEGIALWVRTEAKQKLGSAEAEVAVVTEALAKAAPTALRAVERRLPKDADIILRAADAWDLDALVRAQLRESPRLPSAWRMRQDKLGQALSAGVKEPSREAVDNAREALSELERHALFRDARTASEVKRAEMALRLLAWLAARKLDPPRSVSVPPQRDAEDLGAWYTLEGGYVDWARRVARGSGDSPFDRGVQAVVEAADAIRAELDRRFARSLASWIQSARPAERVVPIEQALKRVAVKFLEGHAERSLLVLLVDGMAWAQAVELLASLGPRAWGPLAWHATREGSSVGMPYPVVLAGLPTLTEVSRAEFFSGRLLGAGETRNTGKDPERFAAHRDLKKFFPGAEMPRLLLRGEGHSLDGTASEEALSLIRGRERRIVGIVVNAIDDSLKGSTQQVSEWTVDHIRSLSALLEAAREAGRSVLIASDHGHVPGDRLKHVGTYPNAGARFRPWTEGDAPKEYEIGLQGNGVCPMVKGAQGVILLADEVSRYGSAAHAGEHGGASLAEVVAPCFLIGTDDPGLELHDADKALIPKPVQGPDWWQFEVWPVQAVATPERPKPARVRSKPPDAQIALPIVDLTPPAPPTRKPTPRPGTIQVVDLESPFARSAVLRSRAPSAEQRKRVVAAVQYLLDRNGVSAAEAFATALGSWAYRVQGLVATFGEVLNVDGYEVISYDPASRTVRLDRAKLSQQFEVNV